MVIGREDVPSTLILTTVSDENENQFLIFLIVIYLIDPDFITLYRKKNFEIIDQFHPNAILRRIRKIAQFQLAGHLVIKTQFAARSDLGFELPVK